MKITLLALAAIFFYGEVAEAGRCFSCGSRTWRTTTTRSTKTTYRYRYHYYSRGPTYYNQVPPRLTSPLPDDEGRTNTIPIPPAPYGGDTPRLIPAPFPPTPPLVPKGDTLPPFPPTPPLVPKSDLRPPAPDPAPDVKKAIVPGIFDLSFRTWKDSTGRHTVKAKMTGMTFDKETRIVLMKENGVTITPKWNLLTEDDQNYIRSVLLK